MKPHRLSPAQIDTANRDTEPIFLITFTNIARWISKLNPITPFPDSNLSKPICYTILVARNVTKSHFPIPLKLVLASSKNISRGPPLHKAFINLSLHNITLITLNPHLP
nr:hypothetical protein Itr_chr13CG19970 [Ipomoea trifida]